MNYIFYLMIILVSLINPVFSLQEKSLITVYKTISFSLILVVFFTSVFFYSQYKNKTLSPVIYDTLKNDLNCDIKKTSFSQKGKISLGNISPNLNFRKIKNILISLIRGI